MYTAFLRTQLLTYGINAHTYIYRYVGALCNEFHMTLITSYFYIFGFIFSTFNAVKKKFLIRINKVLGGGLKFVEPDIYWITL